MVLKVLLDSAGAAVVVVACANAMTGERESEIMQIQFRFQVFKGPPIGELFSHRP